MMLSLPGVGSWSDARADDVECPGSHATGTCTAHGFTERNVYAIFGFCYQSVRIMIRFTAHIFSLPAAFLHMISTD